MSKRKADDKEKEPSKTKMDVDGEDDSSGSDDDASILNVDFEWFDPEPIDFHGLKTLLRQLFDADNQLLDLSALSNLILSQRPLLGSTVKCDGRESDPFAFLTAFSLHRHRPLPAVEQLTRYLLSRVASSGNITLQALLNTYLLPSGAFGEVGLVLSERLINMPHQIVPPLYDMLVGEIESAVEEKEDGVKPFTHYLVVSKVYAEVVSKLDGEEESRPQKKKSKKGGFSSSSSSEAETFYFHPEDEVLKRMAIESCEFDYVNQGDEGASDAKRAFQEAGIRPRGLLMLIDRADFKRAVKAIREYLGEGEGE